MQDSPIGPSSHYLPAAQGIFRKNPFACVAFLVAMVALALAILPASILEPPKAPTGLVGILHWFSSKPDAATIAFETRLRYFNVAGLSVGILAVALAVVGIVRRERRAMAVAALAIATVALVWQYVIIGIVVGVLVLFLATIVN